MTVGNGYIQKNEHKFWQRPKGIDTSKMYTGAICLTNGTVYVYSGTFSDGFGAWDKTLWCGVTSGHAYFRIETGMTEPVKWAALYEGAYDAETLPEYVVPDKRAEMIRCDVPLNPPNLLDNSDFLHPINQLGATSYTGAGVYTINRWIIGHSANRSSVEITSNGVKVSPVSDEYADFSQNFENYSSMAGKTYTVACNILGSGVYAQTFKMGSAYLTFGSCQFHSTADRHFIIRGFESFTLVWAALYEGAYDVDTLPEYVVPNKRIEMTRCGVPLNPPNLLDNSWFVNPINQRGIASGATVASWSYGIDRWANYTGSDGTMTFTNEGIRYSFSNLNQPIPPTVKTGTVVTAAAKWSDGTLLTATGTITRGTAWTWFHSSAAGGCQIGVADQGNSNSVHVTIVSGEKTLVWVALYEGAYDAETLPEYHYKGYAAELAECQRYYIKIATQPVSGWCYNWGRVTVSVPLPVTMRVASPTVSVTSASRNFYIGSTAYAAEPIGSTAVSNGISVYFSHSHTVNGQCIMPEFSAEVSADF